MLGIRHLGPCSYKTKEWVWDVLSDGGIKSLNYMLPCLSVSQILASQDPAVLWILTVPLKPMS